MEQRYFSFIRRWLWLIVLATISAGVITFWISSQQAVTYEASSRLIIGPGIEGLNPSEKDIQTGGRLMQTYAELATTRKVLQTVIDNLGLALTPDELDKLLTVRPTTETQFLTIIVQDGDQNQATKIANVLAEELVRLSPTGDSESGAAVVRTQMREQTTQIEENIDNIEEGIAQLEAELEATEDIEARRGINDQIALERERLSGAHATLALLYDSLQQAITNQVQIVEKAITAEPLPSQAQLEAHDAPHGIRLVQVFGRAPKVVEGAAGRLGAADGLPLEQVVGHVLPMAGRGGPVHVPGRGSEGEQDQAGHRLVLHFGQEKVGQPGRHKGPPGIAVVVERADGETIALGRLGVEMVEGFQFLDRAVANGYTAPR